MSTPYDIAEPILRKIGVEPGSQVEAVYLRQPVETLEMILAQLLYGRKNAKMAKIKDYAAYVGSLLASGKSPRLSWYSPEGAEPEPPPRPTRKRGTIPFARLLARLSPIYWNRPRNLVQALRSCIDGDGMHGVTYSDVDENWLAMLETQPVRVTAVEAFALGIDVPTCAGKDMDERRKEISRIMVAACKRKGDVAPTPWKMRRQTAGGKPNGAR